MLKRALKFFLKASPWIYHLHCGGCNGCDIELAACLAPRFDVERFGIQLVASPRHADILVVTGPISKQIMPTALKIYEQIPDPKVVVAVGSCACKGGVWYEENPENYAILGSADKVLPVDVYVVGCPPPPEAIIDGIVKAVQLLKDSIKST